MSAPPYAADRVLSSSARLAPLPSGDLELSGSRQEAAATYSDRKELEKQLKEQFRQQQRSKRIKQVNSVSLGKGLGTPATETLHEGFYNPQKVLPPLSEEERTMWQVIELRKPPRTTLEDPSTRSTDTPTAEEILQRAGTATTAGEPSPQTMTLSRAATTAGGKAPHGEEDVARKTEADTNDDEEPPVAEEGAPTDIMKYRQTYRAANVFRDARMEVEENITTAARVLDSLSAPFTFQEVLQTLSVALDVVERGDTEQKVSLAMCVREEPSLDMTERTAQRAREAEDPLLLHGAVEVMEFLRRNVFELVDTMIGSAHTAQWVLRYTVTFLQSIVTQSVEEAATRVDMLARCVRLLGDIELMSSLFLSIVSKSEEYEAFDAMQSTADAHINALLNDVESTLDAVLAEPFPSRRQQLQFVEKGIRTKLQRALLFLNEIDYSWSPNVRFHMQWKQRFLGGAFQRIHCSIAPRFTYCTLGFIDQSLYNMVADSRITGRYTGVNPQQAPKVPVALQVEYERVTEKLTFQQIGMLVKEYASLVAGHQLCLGARYTLRKSGPEHNDEWGFYMDEKAEAQPAGGKKVQFASPASKTASPAKPPNTSSSAKTQPQQKHLRDKSSTTFMTGM